DGSVPAVVRQPRTGRWRRYRRRPDGCPCRPQPGLRLRRLPPRSTRGGRRGRGRPRRPRGHADRRGQVALLPAARAHARRPDDRRLAAGVAHAGPGRGARARTARLRGAGQRAAGHVGQPRDGRARGARRAPPALRRAGALLVAGVPRADPRRAGRALRRRRGALRLAVGPRLPPRLLPPGRRGPLARRAGDRRVDGDGDAPGRRRHRRAAGAAGPGQGLDRL
ncbi:MAG: ATP-dependent DNA helicase RecQ, partial [uncultured Solirubrobacteraceae bacterium]